jgi:hypothetical protein
MGRGRGGGDHCLSKEDKEDKEGIPIPPSKPKIWSMAELAVCKTPPLGSSPLTAAPSLSSGGSGGSPWQQNSGFGGLSNPAGGLMRQNPAAVAAALRTTWNGMNLLGGAATATSSTTMAADLSMGALYSEMTAAAGPEEMSDSQTAGGYNSGNGDLRVDETAASPSPHSPLNNSRKLGGGLHHDGLHPHHHLHHQQLSTVSNNNSSGSSHHSPHVIANTSHGLQHHFHSTAYHHQHQHQHQHHHQSHNHHFGLTEGGSGSMMPLSGGGGGGGYLADRLKMAASSLAASSGGGGGGLYEEEDEQDKVPSSLNMQGVYEGNVNKLASSYEASGLSMLTGPCYGDRL